MAVVEEKSGVMPQASDKLHFLFLNIGHFLDHLFTLIFATVAALALTREWGLSYAELIPYATPGFIAFGVFSLPAGWLADRWSREGMIAVFFVGIGLAALATSFATTPLEIAIGLFVVGIFAAIYHPVALALVARQQAGMGMAIAINGVWGNLGVASAALISGFLIDLAGWQWAFIVPGIISIACGVIYVWAFHDRIPATLRARAPTQAAHGSIRTQLAPDARTLLIRITLIIFFTTAVGSLIFQATTFALPKVFEERLDGLAVSATLIGWLAFVVFAVASMAQLIIGSLLDRLGPRTVFLGVATIQIVFFALMPGLTDEMAIAVALGFMLGAFGQIPINDYMIGRMAKSELRASIYGARYVVTFVVLGLTLPLIAWVHANWGFDTLFVGLAFAACALFAAVSLLPSKLPSAEPARA
ncbi:MAG: MFS transporter [Pseudomonadota bacterium]